MFGRVNKSLHQTWLFTQYPHVSCHINTATFVLLCLHSIYFTSFQSVHRAILWTTTCCCWNTAAVPWRERGRPRHPNWHVLGWWWVLVNMGHNKTKAQQLIDLHMKLCQMQLSICGNIWPRSISHHQPPTTQLQLQAAQRAGKQRATEVSGEERGKPPALYHLQSLDWTSLSKCWAWTDRHPPLQPALHDHPCPLWCRSRSGHITSQALGECSRCPLSLWNFTTDPRHMCLW